MKTRLVSPAPALPHRRCGAGAKLGDAAAQQRRLGERPDGDGRPGMALSHTAADALAAAGEGSAGRHNAGQHSGLGLHGSERATRAERRSHRQRGAESECPAWPAMECLLSCVQQRHLGGVSHRAPPVP